MLVSRISPAPSRTTSSAQPTASSPVAGAPAVDEDLPAAAVGLLLRVDGDHDGLRAPRVAAAAHELRRLHRGGVDAHLVGPGREQRAHVVLGADAAADRERHEDRVGRARDDVEQRAAPLVRGGDVEERDLVGAGEVVARARTRPGRPRRASPTKRTPLTTRPSLHVQARDDALREHCQKGLPVQPVRKVRVEPSAHGSPPLPSDERRVSASAFTLVARRGASRSTRGCSRWRPARWRASSCSSP